MAAQVDFYVLKASGDDARLAFACRLTQKAYQLGNRIHLRVADAGMLAGLDSLLWTFSDDSFLPHDVLPDAEAAARVTLALASQPVPADADVCINLCDAAVDDVCPRIAEIISDDEPVRAGGRQRFLAYRERDCELNSHDIGSRSA